MIYRTDFTRNEKITCDRREGQKDLKDTIPNTVVSSIIRPNTISSPYSDSIFTNNNYNNTVANKGENHNKNSTYKK